MDEGSPPRTNACCLSSSRTVGVGVLAEAARIAVVLLGVAPVGFHARTVCASPPMQIAGSTNDFRSAALPSTVRIVGDTPDRTILAVRQIAQPGGQPDRHEPQPPQPAMKATPQIGDADGQPDRHEPQPPQPAMEVTPTPEPSPGAPAGVVGILGDPIGSLTTNIEPGKGELPPNIARRVFSDEAGIAADPRAWSLWEPMCYQWEASALCHQPLYFEEVNLERYGYTSPCLRLAQPVLSGARFFATVPAIPYLVNARQPCECIYTLGHYRPGSCVAYRRHWPELRAIPGSVEAAAVTGLVFLIP